MADIHFANDVYGPYYNPNPDIKPAYETAYYPEPTNTQGPARAPSAVDVASVLTSDESVLRVVKHKLGASVRVIDRVWGLGIIVLGMLLLYASVRYIFIINPIFDAHTECLERIDGLRNNPVHIDHEYKRILQIQTQSGVIETTCKTILTSKKIIALAYLFCVETSWIYMAVSCFGKHAEYHMHSVWIWIAILVAATYTITHVIRTLTWKPTLEQAVRKGVKESMVARKLATAAGRNKKECPVNDTACTNKKTT